MFCFKIIVGLYTVARNNEERSYVYLTLSFPMVTSFKAIVK